MHYFIYKDVRLFCEGVPISKIAEEVGTPFYLYSYKTLKRHINVFDSAFSHIPHITCFAIKANPNLAILKLLANEGAGFDVVSGGELFKALQTGADPSKIVYAGVGKTREEIRYALKSRILMLNVESSQELLTIDEEAGVLSLKAPIALRVNPDIDPKTHPYISTGLKKNKFGIDINEALKEYKISKSLKNLKIVGIHFHIGSQIIHIEPFTDALERVIKLIDKLVKDDIHIKYLDMGGGLGITYKDESPPPPKEFADALTKIVAQHSLNSTFIFEPGRVIVGNAGILVTKVLYRKITAEKNFIIVDAGMNDLIRPSLYGAYHDIWPVSLTTGKSHDVLKFDVVGPICESGDFFAKDRALTTLSQGDLIAIMSAGAYGFSMSSNYNSRPRIPEILVKDEGYFIIRERETYEDLIRGEKIPGWLR